jgi:hypothetical protein
LTEAANEMKQVLSEGLLEPKAKLWFRHRIQSYMIIFMSWIFILFIYC